MLQLIRFIFILGVILSAYSFYVEKKMTSNKKYVPVCDISSNISCTKAFASKYGHLFGISNSLVGIGFYLAALFLTFTSFAFLVFYMAAISMLMTIYLAYISFFLQKNFCLVCTVVYLVNALAFVLSIKLI